VNLNLFNMNGISKGLLKVKKDAEHTPAAPPETLNSNDSVNIRAENPTYLTARNATIGSFKTGSTLMGANSFLVGANYQVRRGFVKFNFSLIPADAVTATLKVKLRGVTENTNLTDVSVERCTNAGTLTTADFDSIGAFYGHSATYEVDGSDYIFSIPLNQDAIDEINLKSDLRFVIRNYDFDYISAAPSYVGSPVQYSDLPTIDLTF